MTFKYLKTFFLFIFILGLYQENTYAIQQKVSCLSLFRTDAANVYEKPQIATLPNGFVVVPLDSQRVNETVQFLHNIFSYDKGTADFNSIANHIYDLGNNKNKDERKIPFYWIVIDPLTNKTVGSVGLYEGVAFNEKAIWVDWFAVDSNYRGSGIGKNLLRLSILEAIKLNLKDVRLYTTSRIAESAAQGLYESLQFYEYRERELEYDDKGSIVYDVDKKTPVYTIFRKFNIK